MNKMKFSTGVAIFALLVAGVAVFVSLNASGKLGGNQHWEKESFMQGLFAGAARQFDVNNSGQLRWGTNGTRLTAIVTGSATIWAPATTIAATTTQQVEFQTNTGGGITRGLTGVTSDSICTITQASTTPGATVSGGLIVTGASASSTDGTIVGKLFNATGATFTWAATASSSPYWNYTCFDPS